MLTIVYSVHGDQRKPGTQQPGDGQHPGDKQQPGDGQQPIVCRGQILYWGKETCSDKAKTNNV